MEFPISTATFIEGRYDRIGAALLLDALSTGMCPVDALFAGRAAFELTTGAPWHTLSPEDCWILVACLIRDGLALVDVAHWDADESRSPIKSSYVGLTREGGKAWEKIWHVDWRFLVHAEDATDPMGTRFAIYSPTSDLLVQIADDLAGSPLAAFFTEPKLASCTDWQWSYWKTFETCNVLHVVVLNPHPRPLALSVPEKALRDICARAGARFKRRDDPPSAEPSDPTTL